jgi:hypothetical protein
LLAETEWNFETEKLSENELVACHAHEYGREIAKRYKPISELSETQWRCERLPRGNSERQQWWAATRKLNRVGIPFSLSSEPRLNVSWYSLPSDIKDAAVKSSAMDKERREPGGLSISTIRELEPSRCTTMELFQIVDEWIRREHHEQIEYGFFSIDWTSDDGRLKENFANWVRQQRQELKERGVTKKPSRGGLRDQLRWLGALRVKECYPHKMLVDYPYPKLKKPAPFSNRSDLYAAAKNANRIIDCRIQNIKTLIESR